MKKTLPRAIANKTYGLCNMGWFKNILNNLISKWTSLKIYLISFFKKVLIIVLLDILVTQLFLYNSMWAYFIYFQLNAIFIIGVIYCWYFLFMFLFHQNNSIRTYTQSWLNSNKPTDVGDKKKRPVTPIKLIPENNIIIIILFFVHIFFFKLHYSGCLSLTDGKDLQDLYDNLVFRDQLQAEVLPDDWHNYIDCLVEVGDNTRARNLENFSQIIPNLEISLPKNVFEEVIQIDTTTKLWKTNTMDMADEYFNTLDREYFQYNQDITELRELGISIITHNTSMPLGVLLMLIHICWQERRKKEKLLNTINSMSYSIRQFLAFLHNTILKTYERVNANIKDIHDYFKENPAIIIPMAVFMAWLKWLKKKIIKVLMTKIVLKDSVFDKQHEKIQEKENELEAARKELKNMVFKRYLNVEVSKKRSFKQFEQAEKKIWQSDLKSCSDTNLKWLNSRVEARNQFLKNSNINNFNARKLINIPTHRTNLIPALQEDAGAIKKIIKLLIKFWKTKK